MRLDIFLKAVQNLLTDSELDVLASNKWVAGLDVPNGLFYEFPI